MDPKPEGSHPWIIMSGLQDALRPPYRMHKSEEIPDIVRTWIRSRQNNWGIPSGTELSISVHCHPGPVVFLSKNARERKPVPGIMLYGTFPLSGDTGLHELSALAALIARQFGQVEVELHFNGIGALITKDMIFAEPAGDQIFNT